MVKQVLASSLVSSLLCVPDCVLNHNDAAAKLYGDLHLGAVQSYLMQTSNSGMSFWSSP